MEYLRDVLCDLIHKLWKKVRKKNRYPSSFQFQVIYFNFEQKSRSFSLFYPIKDKAVIYEKYKLLLDELGIKSIRYLSITFSKFRIISMDLKNYIKNQKLQNAENHT